MPCAIINDRVFWLGACGYRVQGTPRGVKAMERLHRKKCSECTAKLANTNINIEKKRVVPIKRSQITKQMYAGEMP